MMRILGRVALCLLLMVVVGLPLVVAVAVRNTTRAVLAWGSTC